jgi:hypothetical protein
MKALAVYLRQIKGVNATGLKESHYKPSPLATCHYLR